MSDLTFSVVPEPMVSMAMTAATPMTMPSSVRNERSTLRRIESSDEADGFPDHARHLQLHGVGGDVAVEEADGALGIGGDVGLVRDHGDGQAKLAVEPRQQLHDLVRAGGVEIAGRLVGDEQRRPGDDGARDRHALLLAAGEFGRRVVLAADQADLGQRLHGEVAALAGRRRRDRSAAARHFPPPWCAASRL